MSKVIMMIGVPGSGKSTWALNYVLEHPNDEVQIYSSDFYRLMLFGDENDQTHNNEVFSAMYQDIRKAYQDGVDIIIDATNLSYKDRTRTRNSLRGVPITHCVILATPIEKCIERDSHRSRTVGEEVIKRCVCKFEIPTYDEIPSIEIVGDGNYFDVSDIVERMDKFEQHNPHHKYTVGFHCMSVAMPFEHDSVLYKAGMWHDVGKLFTQSFDDKGIGHYYQHANYSAYFMLTHYKLLGCQEDWQSIIDILFYINQHMHIRDILKSSSAIKKYNAIWGKERFDNLVAFNKADNAGSGTESDYENIKKGNVICTSLT